MMPLTRRDFLILLGMGSALGATGGLGAGYLLLGSDSSTASELPTPTTNPTLVARLKTAERPPIVKRSGWGARNVNYSEADEENGLYSLTNPEGWREYEDQLRAVYNTVVIHHSLLYEDDDVSTMQAIQNLHMDDRGWADIGYHFCVGKSGAVYEGRSVQVRGTHTEGHNTGTLGICLLGNFEEEAPIPAQLNSAQEMLNWLALRLRITHLAGHRDFNTITQCPGKNLYPLLDQLAAQALLKRGTDGYVVPAEQIIAPDCCGE
jgi:hypothetical protein